MGSSLPTSAYTTLPQITFVLHDTGETKALQPVMQTLDNAGINYNVLADSTAKSLLSGNRHLVPLPQDVFALSKSNPTAAVRAQGVLNQALSAKCIVTGLVSDFQKSWADFFKKMGKIVVGYYDGFGYNGLYNKADEFANSLNALITPSRDTAAFFRQRFANIPVFALGQPTLETISKTLEQTNPLILATRLGIDLNKPTILFVGGYGKGYNKAFITFCEAIRNFNTKRVNNTNILISLHPKVNGELEHQLLKQYGLQGYVRIVPKEVNSAELLRISNIVLSQNSTMTMQALLQNKQVMLVGELEDSPIAASYNFNPAVYFGFVPRYKTPIELFQAISQTLLFPQFEPYKTVSNSKIEYLYWLFGIPKSATMNIVRYLLNVVQH